MGSAIEPSSHPPSHVVPRTLVLQMTLDENFVDVDAIDLDVTRRGADRLETVREIRLQRRGVVGAHEREDLLEPEVPRLRKITINMGLGEAVSNPKILDTAVEELRAIAGQQPVVTKAKKSIATFKLREGQKIGAMVTLRRERMWEFLDRLVTLALPRLPSLSPRRIASSSPPAPPPTMTMRFGSASTRYWSSHTPARS